MSCQKSCFRFFQIWTKINVLVSLFAAKQWFKAKKAFIFLKLLQKKSTALRGSAFFV